MYLLSDLLDVVGDMPDVVLLVKLHPMTDQNLHNKYKLMIKGKNVNGPAAKTVVVAETPIPEISLKRRAAVHGNIIRSLNKFWKMVK